MADLATKDFPLLSSLKLTDRVVITDANSELQMAAMTVGDFIKRSGEFYPLNWFYKSEIVTRDGGILTVDDMNGLMVVQMISFDARPGIYWVSSWFQIVQFIAGFDYAEMSDIEFFFSDDKSLAVKNLSTYSTQVSVSYQKIGTVKY